MTCPFSILLCVQNFSLRYSCQTGPPAATTAVPSVSTVNALALYPSGGGRCVRRAAGARGFRTEPEQSSIPKFVIMIEGPMIIFELHGPPCHQCDGPQVSCNAGPVMPGQEGIAMSTPQNVDARMYVSRMPIVAALQVFGVQYALLPPRCALHLLYLHIPLPVIFLTSYTAKACTY